MRLRAVLALVGLRYYKMTAEIRQDMPGGCRRGGVFLLSILAVFPLVLGFVTLTEGSPVFLPAVIPLGFLFPAITFLVFWQRGYRCGVCGGLCISLADTNDSWRDLRSYV